MAAEEAMRLTDLSGHPRCGFRGELVEGFLKKAGLPSPGRPNQAETGPDGELVLRLSRTEYWVLDNPTSITGIIDQIGSHPMPAHGCYPLYRQDSHGWFLLRGPKRDAVMAKLCGVDLRADAFPTASIAQTSVARINAVVVSHPCGDDDAISVLADFTYSEYLGHVLQDAIEEFGGTMRGRSLP